MACSNQCKTCRCLDSTSATDSGVICMVGGNEASDVECPLYLPRTLPVNEEMAND